MSRHPTAPPSAWRVESAMAAAQAFCRREDGAAPLAHDELIRALATETDVFQVLNRAIRASMEATAFAKGCGDLLDALRQRKARFEARRDAARSLALAMMEALGETVRHEPDFSVSLSEPGTKLAIDPERLPAEYKRIVEAPNLDKIKEDTAQGVVIDGVEHLPTPPVLTIRSR